METTRMFGGQNEAHYYISNEELSSTKFRLAKLLARCFQQFCMCDRDSVHQVLKYKWRSRKRFRLGPMVGSDKCFRNKREIKRVWPLIVLLVFLFVTIRLTICLYYQFQFDSSHFRLKYLRDSVWSDDDGGSSKNSTLCQEFEASSTECRIERELERRINVSYSTIKRLGNPYVKMGFNIQALILIALSVNYFCYLQTQISWNYSRKMEYYFIDLLLDERGEFEKCQRFIEHEVRLMLNSSRNNILAATKFCMEQLVYASHKCSEPPPHSANDELPAPGGLEELDCADESGAVRNLSDHELLVRHLDRLVRSKLLHPINRTSAEWRNRVVTDFVQTIFSNTLYSFVFDSCILYFISYVSSADFDFQAPMDVVMVAELAINFEIGVIATSYFVACSISHYKSHSRYMGHIIRRIKERIAANERRFALLLGARARKGMRADYEWMNRGLIETFLEYRVFRAQVMSFTPTMTHEAVVCYILMFLSPLIARFYAPHLSGKNAAALGSIFSINIVLFTDILLVPICLFYHKGQRLYRALSSLLAHAIELDLQARKHFQGRRIYMTNTVEMIRKELDDPEKLLSPYLTSFTGFKVTFPRLMELHFYNSVLNLALYCEIDAWKNLLGDRFHDPFQLRKPLVL